MTLTRRGRVLALASGVFALAGRLLGVIELYGIAAAALALVLGALVYVRVVRFRVEAERELRPPRVHAGGASRVELAVRNLASSRSPVLSARDPFDGGRRWARFLLAPLRPGEKARAAYRLPTDQRGIFDLGPLTLELHDPFGVAARSTEAAGATKLTVYPRVYDIAPLPLTRGDDPHAGADHPTGLGMGGEDFYALREYQEGDDLRKVHWAATARLDELMIRQDEMPWQGRATVLLDLRRPVHTPASLEVAVSAAASIVTANWRRQSLLRLVATDGMDSGFANGAAHAEAILEHLAGARLGPAANLGPVLSSLHRQGNGGALAVVTTCEASDSELEGIARLRSRFGQVTLVVLERSVLEQVNRVFAPRAVPVSARVVRVSADSPFSSAWDAVVGGSYSGSCHSGGPSQWRSRATGSLPGAPRSPERAGAERTRDQGPALAT